MYDDSTDKDVDLSFTIDKDAIDKDENLVFTVKYDTNSNSLYAVKTDGLVANNSMWISNSVGYQDYKDRLETIRPCQYHLDILGEILSRKQFLPNILKNIALRMYSFKGENQEEKEKIQDLAEHLYKAADILDDIIRDHNTDNLIEVGKLKRLIKGMKSKDKINLDVFKILGQTEE